MLKAFRISVVVALFYALSVGFYPAPATEIPQAQSLQASVLDGSSNRFPKIDVKAVRMVRCTGGHGTGFVIRPKEIMTAYHVVKDQANCADGETGLPLKLVYWNRKLDIAVLRFPTKHSPRPIQTACSGYKAEATYYSYGFAGVGSYDLMITRMRGTGDYQNGADSVHNEPFAHMRVLGGVVIPGMSGGPILDDHGRVVGMNNLTAGGYHFGFSREVRDTYLCDKSQRK